MKRRKATKAAHPNLWRISFVGDPFMFNRIETIIAYGKDFFPDSSGSAILDGMLAGLLSGETLKSAKAMHGELNPQMQATVDQLYEMRDQGKIGAAR